MHAFVLKAASISTNFACSDAFPPFSICVFQALVTMIRVTGGLPGDVENVFQISLKALEGANAEVCELLPLPAGRVCARAQSGSALDSIANASHPRDLPFM